MSHAPNIRRLEIYKCAYIDDAMDVIQRIISEVPPRKKLKQFEFTSSFCIVIRTGLAEEPLNTPIQESVSLTANGPVRMKQHLPQKGRVDEFALFKRQKTI